MDINTFHRLFRISKIQVFESNSQPAMKRTNKIISCSEYQRYKFLKAIHNDSYIQQIELMVVQNIKDTSFWKQFTTGDGEDVARSKLFRISKIQVFESNSQQLYKWLLQNYGCSEYQRYKFLKAIHNNSRRLPPLHQVVQNIKDTSFWKQFTTTL